MRKINSFILAFGLVPALFLSCVKEANDLLDDNEKFYYDDSKPTSSVKFIHAYTPLTLNGLSTATNGFRILMDGVKVNGATNTSAATNTLRYGGNYDATTYTNGLFPASTTPTATNTYALLPSGYHNIKFVMNRIVGGTFAPATGGADEIFNANMTLSTNKKYSIFLADPYPSPGVLLIEDKFQDLERGQFGIRFVNVCADAATRFDLVSLRFGKIFSDVGYKEIKDFIYLSVPSTSDILYLRIAGTNTVVSQVNSFLPVTERVYTFYARGKTGVTGRGPNLNYYTNW